MGYWLETCFITNLPILQDSEVVAIRSSSEREFLFHYEQPHFFRQDIAKGKIGDYGDLVETNSFCTEKSHQDINDWFSFDCNKKCHLIFCYKDVWDKILTQAQKEPHDIFLDRFNLKEEHREGASVMGYLRRARAGFSDSILRGTQNTNLSNREFIANLTLDKVKEIRKVEYFYESK